MYAYMHAVHVLAEGMYIHEQHRDSALKSRCLAKPSKNITITESITLLMEMNNKNKHSPVTFI